MNPNSTTNTNSNLDPQNDAHRLAHVSPEEMPYEGAGFPGCGDGTDDLADANANEADDYRNEGCGGEDSYLDSYWEDQAEMGYMGE
jgi:hypothetical protein